jgi:hypothetical protein
MAQWHAPPLFEVLRRARRRAGRSCRFRAYSQVARLCWRCDSLDDFDRACHGRLPGGLAAASDRPAIPASDRSLPEPELCRAEKIPETDASALSFARAALRERASPSHITSGGSSRQAHRDICCNLILATPIRQASMSSSSAVAPCQCVRCFTHLKANPTAGLHRRTGRNTTRLQPELRFQSLV